MLLTDADVTGGEAVVDGNTKELLNPGNLYDPI